MDLNSQQMLKCSWNSVYHIAGCNTQVRAMLLLSNIHQMGVTVERHRQEETDRHIAKYECR